VTTVTQAFQKSDELRHNSARLNISYGLATGFPLLDKIAIISDVHGNVPALETVLADIRQRGIDLIYNLGDLVGKGPYSDLAIDRCREVCQVIVKGNWDEFLCADDHPFGTWYREQIGPARLAYLSQLPNVHDFWLSGKRVRLYHASQESLNTRIYPTHPYDALKAMFDNTPFTGLDNPAPDIVGYGDIHNAYMLSLGRDHKILFNAGSVGNPLDMPLATYVILSGMLDSQIPDRFSIDFVRLPYDIEQVVEQAQQVNVPELEAYIVELRTAVYRGRQKAASST
jgi:protein phosphatase